MRRVRRPVAIVAVLAVIPVVWLLASWVDRSALATAWSTVTEQPLGLFVALACFSAAFGLRAVAWRRVLPDLSYGQALSALHVSLGANHVLPLRMGEPLRVVSIVRRGGIDWARATASTVTLRAGDVIAIGALGAAVGVGSLGGSLGLWVSIGVAALVAGGGAVWISRLRASQRIRLPGPVALGATVLAWGFESVVVWQAASWVGIEVSYGGAVLVTAASVVAQLVAIAPGGLGTYEAGGTAALVYLGHEPAIALAAVLTAHAVKTAYSLLGGAIAMFVPDPGMLGRIRLQPCSRSPAPMQVPAADAPIVLFLPAHNEEDSVARVISRVPSHVLGRPVRCLVVDDGSTDTTAALASEAGAEVISLPSNRGLGAAVRRGLEEALGHDPAAIAFCDADGEYAPEELERMVSPILAGEADYVVGSRFDGDIERMLPHRRLGNRLLTAALSWIARRRISDGQSGYRAFSPRAAAAADVIHDFNYAQVITLDLLAKGMRYHEVPISYSFRTTGRSFVRLGRYLKAVIPAVFREVNTA